MIGFPVMICYPDLFVGCVENGDDALKAAQEIGFPVMICYPDLFVGCVENGDDAL